MAKLRVAMIAPPWLSIPPNGYGGIEEVIYNLTNGLRKLGVDVELFTIKPSTIPGVKKHYYYQDEQYAHIHKPLYETTPVAVTQVMFALKAVAEDGKYDLIHDHNGFLGPLALYWANRYGGLPPALHTHHGPPFSDKQRLEVGIPDNLPMWGQFGGGRGLYLVGISASLMKPAPEELKQIILPPVHHGLDVTKFPYLQKKADHFITLGRFSRDKGQHTAVQLCDELGYKLEMAGIVAGISNLKQLVLELANPLSNYRGNGDFQYYSDHILPTTIKNPKIRYIGNISGQRKLSFFAQAKAFLFPIDWEEPFGMVLIEALACGTPVVAMNRGSVPEIIEHGKNGFIANTVKEFQYYMQKVDEIDPAACRRTVEEKFSVDKMARNYLDRYNQILSLEKSRP